MPLFLFPLMALLSSIFSPITAWIRNKGETMQAEHGLELARLFAATELAKTEMAGNVQVTTAQLAATTSSFKDFTFLLLMTPIIITCIWPSRGQNIFANLSLVPQYYSYLVITVYGAIWGIQNIAVPIANHSIAKATINKQEFFNNLRKTQGSLPQNEVAAIDKVIDEISGGA